MTSDRHDPDATPELHDEFWGEQTEWTPQPQSAHARPGLGAAIGRWWTGLAGGTEHAGRVHADPRTSRESRSSPAPSPVGPLALPGTRSHHDDGVAEDEIVEITEDAWDLEPEPQPTHRPGVDPLIARLGGLAVVLTLAAPLVLGVTASGSDSDANSNSGDALPAAAATSSSDQVAADPVSGQDQTAIAATDAAAPAAVSSTAGDTAVDGDVAAATAPPAPPAPEPAMLEAASESDAQPAATPSTVPPTTVASCGNDYELSDGDYWIRIADAAGVSLAELLDVNNASVDTVLVPGRSICLPVGASTPAPPTTVATTTPSTQSRTTPTSTSGSSTQTPATTAAPTTTAPPRPAAVPESEATAIIREVWPDELEERALEIAWRESNHRSNVNNFCCYGLFQIYFSVHRSWLASLGVDSADDLFDPRVNAIAAYTLYQRAGGWGPWGG